MWLETRLTKNEILKLYLDRAYMGGGTFGVDGAAHFYFNKSARDVTLSESAMLAGLFKAPTKYAPHINLPAARARANVVLDNLVDAGFMTEGQVFGARRNPAIAVDRRDENSPNYYLDYAFEEIRKLVDTFPKSYTERVFVVRTSIDMTVQRAAEGGRRKPVAPVRPRLSRDAGCDRGRRSRWRCARDGRRTRLRRRASSTAPPTRCASPVRRSSLTSTPRPSSTATSRTSIIVDGPVCIGNWCPQNYGHSYSGAGDADAGDHAVDQRGAGQDLDRARRQVAEPG